MERPYSHIVDKQRGDTHAHTQRYKRAHTHIHPPHTKTWSTSSLSVKCLLAICVFFIFFLISRTLQLKWLKSLKTIHPMKSCKLAMKTSMIISSLPRRSLGTSAAAEPWLQRALKHRKTTGSMPVHHQTRIHAPERHRGIPVGSCSNRRWLAQPSSGSTCPVAYR